VVSPAASGARGSGLDLAPFFIQWAAGTPHPSTTSSGGCRLASIDLVDPAPAALRRLLETAGFAATVREGPMSMRVTLECAKGRVTFGE